MNDILILAGGNRKNWIFTDSDLHVPKQLALCQEFESNHFAFIARDLQDVISQLLLHKEPSKIKGRTRRSVEKFRLENWLNPFKIKPEEFKNFNPMGKKIVNIKFGFGLYRQALTFFIGAIL